MPRRRWIKLWTQEMLYGTTSQELDLAEQAIWFKFLALAGDSPEPGQICVAPGIPFTEEQLVAILGAPIPTLRGAIEKMVKFEKIIINDGIIHIVNWLKYQTTFDRDEYMREYMHDRRERERKKQEGGVSEPVKQDVNLTHNKPNHQTRPDQIRSTNTPPLPTPTRKQVAPDPRVKEILGTISEKLGYEIPHYAKEGAAVKRALKMGFSPEQFIGCWDTIKEFSFWQGKWLPLAKVTENLGEFAAGRLKERREYGKERGPGVREPRGDITGRPGFGGFEVIESGPDPGDD